MSELKYCTKKVGRGSYGSSHKCGRLASYIVTMQHKKSGATQTGLQRCEQHKTSGTVTKKVIKVEPIAD